MANKRSNLVELTRDEPDRDEDYQIDPVQQADAGTMAKRKIAKPRSRRANGGQLPSAPQPVANPFAALNQDTAEEPKANPFAGIGGGSGGAGNNTNPFSFTKPAAAPVPASESGSKSAGPSKEIQRRALNEKFQEKVADLFKNSLYEDWTKVLESYVKYAQQIEKGDVKLPEEADKKVEPVKDVNRKDNKPEPVTVSDDDSDDDVKIEGPQFTLTNPPTMKDSPFSFNKPVEADKEKAGKGFTFTSTASNSVFKLSNDTKQDESKTQSGPSFSFGSDKTKVDEEQSKPAFSFGTSEKKDDNAKPSFTFGTSEKKDDKPTFTFGSSEKKDDKPAFSFGSSEKKDDKPAFTFGSSSDKKDESKPAFTFGSSSADKKEESKPAFSFGASSGSSSESKPLFGVGSSTEKKDDSKPTFSFGSSAEKKDDSKPSFTFGSSTTTTDDKPKFSFGSSTTWSPEKGIKFGSAGGDDQGPSKPAFTFGGNSSSNTSPFKFSNAGGNTTNESNENKEQEATTDETAQDTENNEPQSNLSEKGPGEEEEDAVYEKKAKVYELVNGEYKVQGVGPLRVLTHQTNKKTRILVRAEGSGRVILNTLLRSQIKYTVEGKGQVKVIDIKSDGKPTTYMIRVKTQEDGENLRNVLEEHKVNA
jgi:nucleoporin NUP2